MVSGSVMRPVYGSVPTLYCPSGEPLSRWLASPPPLGLPSMSPRGLQGHSHGSVNLNLLSVLHENQMFYPKSRNDFPDKKQNHEAERLELQTKMNRLFGQLTQ